MVRHVEGFRSTFTEPTQLNMTTFIKSTARNYPDREIVSGTGEDQVRYSYDEAYDRMKQLANGLENLGVEPGDRIGVLAFNDYRHFEMFFGVPGTGAAFLQLNLRLHPETLAYIMGHSEPRFLIVDEALLELAESFADEADSVEGYIVLTDRDVDEIDTDLGPLYDYQEILSGASPDYEWPVVDEDSTAVICYTTGTTGRPKAVCYSHRSNYLATLQTANFLDITQHDVALQVTPMFHIMGGVTPLAAAYGGAKMVFPGQYSMEDPEPLVDLMVQEDVSFASGVPLIYEAILAGIRDKYGEDVDLDGARFQVGGTPPSKDLILGWKEHGADLMTTYGATETTALIRTAKTRPYDELSPDEEAAFRQHGLVEPGVEVKLVDPETGEEVPRDGESIGEVYVRSPWTATEYYDDARSAESFEDGYWKSGDLGRMDDEGYLVLVDRLKDGIKSGGEWISSTDMENALAEHPDVEDAAVIGLEHDKWEERPFALVVPVADGSVDVAELREHLDSQSFADWQLPDEIEFVDEVPKTSVGKNDKVTLRDRYEGRYVEA